MSNFFQRHPKSSWAGIAVLILVAVLIVALSLLDWNRFRPAIARAITAKTGRPASIDGDLKVHLWSWNPTAEINGLKIKNPPWADRDLMFGADRITIAVSLGRLLRGQIVLPLVELTRPDIGLERDAKGRASWEFDTPTGKPNKDSTPAKLPAVNRLLIQDGKLHVVDQLRKLSFNGSLVASDQAGHADAAAFKVRSKGMLNAKPFSLDVNGGPLLDLEPSKPYSFTTHLTASDITLDTQVTVLKPFDLGGMTVKFVVSGRDLADGYYLTGLALPNTPHYKLAATVHVAGTKYTVEDLKGQLGSSDISGRVQVTFKNGKPKLVAKLASKALNIVDLAPTVGQRTSADDSLAAAPTAGKPVHKKGKADSQPATPAPAAGDAASQGLLLPDADLQVERVRGMDADVTYEAASVVAKVPMKHVNIHLVLDNGLLTIDPLAFELESGQFAGKVQINARGDVPVTDIDMRIQHIDLGQFKSASMTQAPLEGTMEGRFQFHGAGSSLHKFAGASDGAMSVVIPHGEVEDAFAELTGINVLEGLGLLISKGHADTEIRCGIIDFKDQQGSLNTTTVYVDTSKVLITGRGKINLDTEQIDMALQGDPKKIRLVRLRSPISLHGTLLHPGVGLKADKLAEQAAVATVLGVLLTPAAAAIAFIDPGLAKDKDCSTVLAQADAGVQN